MGKGEQSPLSAVAQSDVLALFVAYQELEQLLQAHPAIGVALEHLRQGEATLVQQAISRSLTSQVPG